MYTHAGITLAGNTFWIDCQINYYKVSPDNINVDWFTLCHQWALPVLGNLPFCLNWLYNQGSNYHKTNNYGKYNMQTHNYYFTWKTILFWSITNVKLTKYTCTCGLCSWLFWVIEWTKTGSLPFSKSITIVFKKCITHVEKLTLNPTSKLTAQ